MTNNRADIRIVVDAMGGDHAPGCVIQGALDALRTRPGRFTIMLAGPRDRISEGLAAAGASGAGVPGPGILHAPEVIDMHDSPTAALKTKKDSSIAVGLQAQRSGEAEAFVSAGNTGAVLSASTLILGRLAHVGRPTIGALIPTARRPCLLVDAGANVDCRARHLFEFGVMGAIYAGAMLGIPSPSVGLLNIGEEASKGNEAAREAYRLFAASTLPFKGNLEGRDVLSGDVDVIVCDGFTGNILLKFGESIPSFFKAKFAQLAARSLVDKVVGLIARKSLRSIMKELDYQEHGGVPVLGVNGVSIIGHGRSTPRAITNMIFRAEEMVARGVHRQIEASLARFETVEQ